MDDRKAAVARSCLECAHNDTMSFPQIVGTLMQEGFESYLVDFRRATATYYLPDGDSIALPTHTVGMLVAPDLDTASVQAAIRNAQQRIPGYTYTGFCRTIAAAGCVGYMVSFTGRRAVYFGRTGETHEERFPD